MSTLDDLELFQIVPPLLEVLRRQGVDRLSRFQMSAVRSGLTKGGSQILVTHDFDEAFEIAEISLLNTVATDFKARAVVLCPNPHQAERRYKSISQRCSRLSIPTSEIGRRRMVVQNDGAFGRVIVATYTAFDLASRLNPDMVKDVKCVLIDRLDLIGQPDIGARLETSLVTLLGRPNRQYIGICPPLENVADLSRWLSAEIVRDPKEDVNRVFGVKSFENPDDSLADLTEFVHARRGQIMVLCAGSTKSEELAEQLAGIADPDSPAVLELELTPQQKEKLRELAQDIMKPYPTCITSARLGVTLRRGVGFIHEGVSTIQRRTVTQAWETGTLPVVVLPIRFAIASGLKATMVFLMGVFMEEPGSQGAQGQEMTMLTEWQMGAVLGAAGRRGKDNDAFGIVVVDKESERTRVISKYFRLDQKRRLIPREGEVDSVMDEPENIQDLVLMQLCGKRESGEDPFSVISRTLWGSKNTVTDLSEFSEQTDEPIERLLMQRATKTTHERAREIPDSSVRLVSVRPDKIEGLVRSGSRELWHYVSLKAKDGVSCSCESWKFQGIKRHRLCKHLLKFSSFVTEQSDTKPYAAGVIRQALRGMEVFGELESDGLIARGKEGVLCTDVGRNTAYLGVPMKDARRVMDAIGKEKGSLKILLKQAVLARGRVDRKIVDEVLARIPADTMEEVICEDHMPGIVENCLEEIEYMNSLLLRLMEKKHSLRKESEKLEQNLLALLGSVR